jgi:hypothetical protein
MDTDKKICGQPAQIERSSHGFVRIRCAGKTFVSSWREEWPSRHTISVADFERKMDILENEATKEMEKDIRAAMKTALTKKSGR